MSKMQQKIINMYLNKQYQLNIPSFYMFLNQRSKLDSFQIQLVKQKIQEFQISDSFDKQTLRFLLKIMTAVQLHGQKIKLMNKQLINSISGNFNFKSKNPPITQQIQIPQSKQINNSQQTYMLPNPQPAKWPNKIYKQQQTSKSKQQSIKSKQQSQQKIITKQIKQIKQQIKRPVRRQSIPKQKMKQLSTIKQVQNSTEINLNSVISNNGNNQSSNSYTQKNNEQQSKGPKFIDLSESKDLKGIKRAKIINYQKFSADYVSPVIKYKIEYDNKKVLRRFSDFEKLINTLKQQYEGFILPKLPPKQGIKQGMNYFWGIDQTFLQQRKKKLQDMINRLLQNQFVNHDKTLFKFLTDSNYQIQYNTQGYGTYLKTLTDIVLNAKQLKDYSVAYCNYLRQKGGQKLNSQVETKYIKILQIVQVFRTINLYRKRINTNFDKRRQLIHEMQIKSRNPTSSRFDRMMDMFEQQIQDLDNEIQNYKQLKSRQSWIHELIRQKQGDGAKTIHDLNNDRQVLQKRITKIQSNLNRSLQQFQRSKIIKMKQISSNILQWREKVHP